MRRLAVWLVVLGWVLFGASLLLPAVKTGSLPEMTAPGWSAALVAVVVVTDLKADIEWLLVALAGLGNLVFLLSPLALFESKGWAGRLVPPLLVVSIGVDLALLLLAEWSKILIAGYYVWLSALVLVTTGLYLSREAALSQQVETV